jgi:hypothetical protein
MSKVQALRPESGGVCSGSLKYAPICKDGKKGYTCSTIGYRSPEGACSVPLASNTCGKYDDKFVPCPGAPGQNSESDCKILGLTYRAVCTGDREKGYICAENGTTKEEACSQRLDGITCGKFEDSSFLCNPPPDEGTEKEKESFHLSQNYRDKWSPKEKERLFSDLNQRAADIVDCAFQRITKQINPSSVTDSDTATKVVDKFMYNCARPKGGVGWNAILFTSIIILILVVILS